MKAIIISMKNALLISKSLRGIKYAKEVVGGGSEDTTKQKCKKHALQLGPHFDPFKAKKACVWRTKRFEAVPVAAANAHSPHWAILTQLTNFPSNDICQIKNPKPSASHE